MPAVKTLESTTIGEASPAASTNQTMGLNQHGLYRSIPRIQRAQLPLGHYMLYDEHGASHTGTYNNDSDPIVMDIPPGDSAFAWTTKFHSQ